MGPNPVVIDLTGDTDSDEAAPKPARTFPTPRAHSEHIPPRNPLTPSAQLRRESRRPATPTAEPARAALFTPSTASRPSSRTPRTPAPRLSNAFFTPASTPFYTPAAARGAGATPLLGAAVYVEPALLARAAMVERLVAHGVASFDAFCAHGVRACAGGILMIDAERRAPAQAAIKALRGEPEGKWEVWDWRVVLRPTVQELAPGERGRWELSRML